MLIASLHGEEVNPDRLPGDFIPWHKICAGAKCVRFDEISGVIHVWNGNGTVNSYDTCGRLIDYWKYHTPVTLARVIQDMTRRSAGS